MGEGIVKLLSAFVDDSGRDGLPVFVLCGLVSSNDRWEVFSSEWNAQKNEELNGRALKMKQFMKSISQDNFEYSKNVTLMKFQDLINKYVECGVVIIVSVDHYKKHIADNFKKKEWQREYNFSVSRIIWHVLSREYCAGRVRAARFIFDTQVGEEKLIKNWWAQTKRNAPGRIRRRMGETPIWCRDEDYPPLQAADMVAWAYRRDAADVLGDAGALNPHRKNHALLDFSVLSTRFPSNSQDLTPAVASVLISRLLSRARPAWANLKIEIIKEIWGEAELLSLQHAMNNQLPTSPRFGSGSNWGF